MSKAEVYVGAEEPTTGEKMWFRKGKNLLNLKNNYSVTSNGLTFSYNSTTKKFRCQGTLTGTSFYLMIKNIYDMGLDLSETKDYTMSIDKDIPANVLLRSGTEKMSEITCLETGDKSAQIVNKDKKADTIYIYANSATNGTVYDFEFRIQIEKGLKATPYEDYVEPRIYIRNSNGVYEEFIKKQEDTGWINGTTIGNDNNNQVRYRKVGNIVYISSMLYLKELITVNGMSNYNLFTLPENFRPAFGQRGTISIKGTDNIMKEDLMYQINTNGEVSLFNSSTSNISLICAYFSLSYPV